MPIHDWTKVGANTFHHFHSLWIGELSNALNAGILPKRYYAMAEQHAIGAIADVLTLEESSSELPRPSGRTESGVALLEAPPKVSVVEKAGGPAFYANQRRTLAIRNVSDDVVVAMLEILSPGNKSSQDKLREFVHKPYEAVSRGIHLTVIDLFQPGSFDPQGVHGELHRELGFENEMGEWPVPSKPLTLASYDASELRAYVEPVALGQPMMDMPLFLQAGRYINVPLEKNYLAAYKGVPERWKRVIEA